VLQIRASSGYEVIGHELRGTAGSPLSHEVEETSRVRSRNKDFYREKGNPGRFKRTWSDLQGIHRDSKYINDSYYVLPTMRIQFLSVQSKHSMTLNVKVSEAYPETETYPLPRQQRPVVTVSSLAVQGVAVTHLMGPNPIFPAPKADADVRLRFGGKDVCRCYSVTGCICRTFDADGCKTEEAVRCARRLGVSVVKGRVQGCTGSPHQTHHTVE
jgi:hypothetical protein